MKSPIRAIIGFIFIVILLVAGYLLISPGEAQYTLTPTETLDEIMKLEDEVFPEDLGYLLEDQETQYFFIDVRTPYEYQNSHIENAINIPIHFFLDRDNKKLFDQLERDSAVVVLYGRTQLDANKGWMFLKQLGYNNVKVLLGGYEYYTTGPLDLYDMPDIPGYLVEEPDYDFATTMEEMTGGAFETTSNQPEMVITKRKKKKNVVEGGC
jgi:rhodanese-related sulfurtransferase